MSDHAQNLLEAVTALALLSVSVFVAVYAYRARSSWWRDPLGRMLMLGGAAMTLLVGVGSARRIDSRIDSVDLTDWLTYGSIVAYLAVAVVWAYKTVTVWRETEPPEDDGPAGGTG
ncbi:hypothetical protein EEW87_16330 [Janibacter melonis]|uniref:Uncharacterized protein n=1 Tax=Janibacter melonis TaxID=262209 RepID=A0A650GCR7_9MICO|nr:hypothetical protein [Janibacter melonis]QGX08238.1 hypothetical protein EEW87_16330 [Janibacter melonis]